MIEEAFNVLVSYFADEETCQSIQKCPVETWGPRCSNTVEKLLEISETENDWGSNQCFSFIFRRWRDMPINPKNAQEKLGGLDAATLEKWRKILKRKMIEELFNVLVSYFADEETCQSIQKMPSRNLGASIQQHCGKITGKICNGKLRKYSMF